MTRIKDWTAASVLDRTVSLGYLLAGMVAYVRGAVRRGWRWLRQETEIPDPLQVLPEASRYTISVDGSQAGTWAIHDRETGSIWGPFRYDETPTFEDPVKRAYDTVAETNRVLAEVFGEAWTLPDDPFDPGVWEAITAQIGDPYRWPEIDRGPE